MLSLKQEPNADQDGCRNRCLFNTESEARISEIRSTDQKANALSIKNVIKTKNQNFGVNRQGLGRIRIGKQRDDLYNFSINWLTQIGTE